MGWCHDFEVEIGAGCDHPMRPGVNYCSCAECGVVCYGKFDTCSDVWLQDPHVRMKPATTPAERRIKEPSHLPSPLLPRSPTIRLAEPIELPDNQARPPNPAPVPVSPDDVEQLAVDSLAGMVATEVRAAGAEQPSAADDVTDARFAELSEEIRNLREESNAAATRLLDGLKASLARRDDAIEARLASYQVVLDGLQEAVMEVVSNPHHDDTGGTQPSSALSDSGIDEVRREVAALRSDAQAADERLRRSLERSSEALAERDSELEAVLTAHQSVLEEVGRQASEDNRGRRGPRDDRLLASQLQARLDAHQAAIDDLQQAVVDLAGTSAGNESPGPAVDDGASAGTTQQVVGDLQAFRQELGRLRDESRARADRDRRAMNEKARASASRDEQIEARLAWQQASLDKMEKTVIDLGANLPRAVAEDTIPRMVAEAVASALGPILEDLRTTQAAWNEALQTLRADSSTTTRNAGHDHDGMPRPAELNEDLDNRFAAQWRALDLVGARVSGLLADARAKMPSVEEDATSDEPAGRELHSDWPGPEAKRSDVPARLGGLLRRLPVVDRAKPTEAGVESGRSDG